MKSKGVVFKSRDYTGSAEPPATVLEDQSRFKNHGTFSEDGEPDWVRLPTGLWVIDGNGQDESIDCGNDNSLAPLLQGSLEFWFYPHSLSVAQYLIDKDINAGALYAMVAQSDATMDSYITANGSKKVENIPISLTTWAHWFLTWSKPANNTVLFKNGDIVGETSLAGETPTDIGQELFIGARSDAPTSSNLNGRMVFIRIRSRAFSAPEVASRFQAKRHWFGI